MQALVWLCEVREADHLILFVKKLAMFSSAMAMSDDLYQRPIHRGDTGRVLLLTVHVLYL